MTGFYFANFSVSYSYFTSQQRATVETFFKPVFISFTCRQENKGA